MDRAGLIYLARALTPLHPGAGESIMGMADLPIQRDRLGVPTIEGPSLKGGLRSRLKAEVKKGRMKESIFRLLFGSEPREEELKAGSVMVLDALPLLVPVRSLFGGWAYVTSPWLLFLFSNRLDMVEGGGSRAPAALALDCLNLRSDEAMASDGLKEKLNNEEVLVLLDEYVLKRKEPSEPYSLFAKAIQQSRIADLEGRLAVVSDELLRIFLDRAMRLPQRVRLTANKTVEQGPWGEEQIPPDTVLHVSFLCSKNRVKVKKEDVLEVMKQAGSAEVNEDGSISLNPDEVKEILRNNIMGEFFLAVGGDETVGRGILELREFKPLSAEKKGFKPASGSPKPKVLSIGASISERATLIDSYQRARGERPKDYVKGLQNLPTFIAQAGIMPTYFYYKRKSEEGGEKERAVWDDISGRIRKVMAGGLRKDELPDPLRLMLLERDAMKFAIQLKRVSKALKKGEEGA